jgi:hypothetical protein
LDGITQSKSASDGFGAGADERKGEHGAALSQAPAPVNPSPP